MFTLSDTQSHYIRCIKPNTQSSAGKFDAVYVQQQLEACGVVETVDISCKGYPTRYNTMSVAFIFPFLLVAERSCFHRCVSVCQGVGNIKCITGWVTW